MIIFILCMLGWFLKLVLIKAFKGMLEKLLHKHLIINFHFDGQLEYI